MPGVSLALIQENTGFIIQEGQVPEMAPPTPEELFNLGLIDPRRLRDMETA